MKEVCTACGLTERAVRFHVQEGLAAPDAQRRGGRTWLDFSPADVERLKAIATLRRAGFTVEELRAMTKNFPQAAPEAAFALRRRLRERLDAYERVCQSDPALAEGLAQTSRLINQAYQGFNTVRDPDLIESYVYEINSLQSRYSYLLRRMKELDGARP